MIYGIFMQKTEQDIDLINSFLESEEYYTAQSTPLKSAELRKEEDRQMIEEALRFTTFEKELTTAFEILPNLLLPRIGQDALENLINEFENRNGEESKTTQIRWGISQQTMQIVYDLGKELLENNRSDQANPLFTLLHYLNPETPDYLLGKGIALCNLNQFHEAKNVLNITKAMLPTRAAPFIYSALVNVSIGDRFSAEEDLKQAELILGKNKQEKEQWNEFLNFLK